MAFVITLNFNFEINTSLQTGDNVYWTSTSPLGGFEQNNSLFGGQTHFGTVLSFLSPTQIEVFSEYTDSTGAPLPGIEPGPNDYISFSKNRIVNNNDLLGYYATVQFVNNSTSLAKLWAVGSGITENSK
jgi:hypothetical protein|tara:strand:- start:1568 stop:1954 length:387 start_codon:yes stop_codon:yes gene_type:complete